MYGKYWYVWSAAGLQAKSEADIWVCANVFGLWWSQRLLAMMESARSLPYKLLIDCRHYVWEHGIDSPVINGWKWPL